MKWTNIFIAYPLQSLPFVLIPQHINVHAQVSIKHFGIYIIIMKYIAYKLKLNDLYAICSMFILTQKYQELP